MAKNRKLAIIVAVVMTFFVVFSAFFLVVQADHTCCGNNCPICYQLNMCENTLKSFSGAVVVAAVAFAIILLLSSNISMDGESHFKTSLVNLKVKLTS